MEEIHKTSGRYRLNEEDKAKPVSLKLHQIHLDKLDWLPGKTLADKIRILIDERVESRQREMNQAKEITKFIGPLYVLSKDLLNPVIKENPQKFNSKKESLISGVENLNRLINVMHFDFSTLRKYITPDEVVELDIIFQCRDYLRDQ